MSYTIQLRDIIEQGYKLPLHTYPIYQESHREELNAKIIRRYWYRDIGSESVPEFMQRLETKMHEIMPDYNPLYESIEMMNDFDLFNSVQSTVRETEAESTGEDISTQNTRGSDTSSSTRDGRDENSSNTRAVTKSYNSSYPQTGFSDDAPRRYAENGATADSDTTAAGEATSHSTDKTKAESTGISEGKANSKTASNARETITVSGRTGSVADLVQAYRNAIINVDKLILDELEDLFLQLWGETTTLYPQPYTTYYNYRQWRLF